MKKNFPSFLLHQGGVSAVLRTGWLITILLISATCLLSAQTPAPVFNINFSTSIKFEPKTYLAGGKVGTLNIEVRNYDVYQVATSGQYYVNVTNSSGTVSRKYLGYKPAGGTQEYLNNTIFYNTDITKCWIWTVDRYGQLYKMDLPDWMALDFKRQISNL